MSFRSSVFIAFALILTTGFWVWDHWRLRGEIEGLREAIAARPVPAAAAESALEKTHPGKATAGNNAPGMAPGFKSDDAQLLRVIALRLASQEKVFDIKDTDGVKSVRFNPLAGELAGLSSAQQAQCSGPMDRALADLARLHAENPQPWKILEETPTRQVFKRVLKPDTRTQAKSLQEGLLKEWGAILLPDQLSLISEAAGQFLHGEAEETEEITFDVEDSGSVRQTRERRSGDAVFSKDSSGAEDSVPAKLTELREVVRKGQ